MIKFVTTSGTAYHLEQIISSAEESITLISPYLKLTQNFIERLQDADKRGVTITIVYGKKQLKEPQMAMLRKLSGLNLHFSKNLHAKCYSNERSCLISSMNLYEYSEKNNREMGVYIERQGNEDLFKDVMVECKSILHSSVRKPIEEPTFADFDFQEPDSKKWELPTEDSEAGELKSIGWVIAIVFIVLFFKFC